MPWMEKNVMDLRFEFVIRALQERTPFVELCQEYGISAKTGYKWKERFIREGPGGLEDRSRRPKKSPTELTEEEICEIIYLKNAHMSWGYRKIRVLYGRAHPRRTLPSESSFKRVLEKAGLVKKRRKRSSKRCGRLQNHVEAEKSNDVWTVDFKGYWYTAHGERCEPLTVRDAFSRYILCASIPENARTETVRGEFEGLFEKYGLPGTIRSDNGSPFAAPQAPFGLSRLSAWWAVLGIDLDRITPGRPCENGAHERMHLDIAREIEGQVDGDLKCQASALEIWRQGYNRERPHEAIGMQCPVDVYERSSQPYEGTPDRLVYPSGFFERKVQKTGGIWLGSKMIKISSALQGWNVGLSRSEANQFSVYFGRLCLGSIDLTTESFQTCRWTGPEHASPPAHA